VCVVVLTRDNRTVAERPKQMTVQLTEKDGQVTGTLHYREDLLQPIDCRLDALVSGNVEAPAPRPAPPVQLAPPPSPPLPPQPIRSAPRIGTGVAPSPGRP
jgi:hypothetical protein